MDTKDACTDYKPTKSVLTIAVALLAMAAGQWRVGVQLSEYSSHSTKGHNLIVVYTVVSIIFAAWFFLGFSSQCSSWLSHEGKQFIKRRFFDTWRFIFCTLPLVCILDDMHRSSDELIQRLLVVLPNIKPFLIYVYLFVGGIHGALPTEDLLYWLQIQTCFTVFRGLCLCIRTNQITACVRAVTIITIPINLGFHVARAVKRCDREHPKIACCM